MKNKKADGGFGGSGPPDGGCGGETPVFGGNPLLVVPAYEKGVGGGHLVRSLELVRSLRSQNREAYLYIPELEKRASLVQNMEPSWLIQNEETAKSLSWGCIILDRFKTPPEEFAQWSALAPLIGIDEGGSMRNCFDFLIDLLPGLPTAPSPNILAPHLLPLPKNQRSSFYRDPKDQPLQILVSFGAEDPENLTIPVCLALTSLEKARITALFGGLNHPPKSLAGVRILKAIPELREHLAEYDLVITHFGLTAFECLSARVPALLVSPGAYHEALARHAGFISAGIGVKGANRTGKMLSDQGFWRTLEKQSEQIRTRFGLEASRSLGELLGNPHFPSACPACRQSQSKDPPLARFPDRTYRRCTSCGMVYMLRPAPPPIEYEKDYFFGFYKKQYGKTYLEDFPNLIKNGKTRLAHIQGLLPPSGEERPRLLDIGCAYGPFLVAAQEAGFSPIGLDPAEDGVRYVREELKIPAFQGFFPLDPLPDGIQPEAFTVVSLWYVIEHFENPGAVLGEIHRLLKPGGVLAFSTPSFGGISRRVSEQGFLEKSPPDHWTVWDPRHTGSLLERYGFALKKIVVSGHHPERFPLFGSFLNRKKGVLYRLCLGISRLFRLGDTFEVYAVKQ